MHHFLFCGFLSIAGLQLMTWQPCWLTRVQALPSSRDLTFFHPNSVKGKNCPPCYVVANPEKLFKAILASVFKNTCKLTFFQ